MKRQWIFCLDVLFLGIVCTLLFADSVMAAVNSTTETAGGMNTVYVVGNPDCYPAEYYNPSTSSYEGILPELLNRISEKTGLNFTYICAGKKDRRLNLAKNSQAELVSGVITEDLLLKLTSVTPGDVIFTVPGENGDTQVSFAYTAIADETLISTMENALKEISEQEISSIVFRFMAEHPQKSYPAWLLPVLLGVIVLMFIMVLILFVKFRKFKKKDDRSVWIDEVLETKPISYGVLKRISRINTESFTVLPISVLILPRLTDIMAYRKRKNSFVSQQMNFLLALGITRSLPGSAAAVSPCCVRPAVKRRRENGLRRCFLV